MLTTYFQLTFKPHPCGTAEMGRHGSYYDNKGNRVTEMVFSEADAEKEIDKLIINNLVSSEQRESLLEQYRTSSPA